VKCSLHSHLKSVYIEHTEIAAVFPCVWPAKGTGIQLRSGKVFEVKESVAMVVGAIEERIALKV
jgi:uncharacterized protein YlzI (FlbEa/FlbD family)